MPALTPSQELTRDLIRCPSVTPAEGGALDLLEERLTAAGFTCHRLPFGDGDARIDNLFAIYGSGGRHFCFAGHTDVVPAGDHADWRHDPFGGEVEDGVMYGRGAVDMKGAIGAFTTSAINWITQQAEFNEGRVSLLITGDEEGDAIHGTRPVLAWLDDNGLMPDAFLVGEPTNPDAMGDVIKNGRRGSLSCELTVDGAQGHAAYPHRSDNPLPRLMAMLAPLATVEIDDGNAHFDPSTAAITSIDTGNPARNVTPARATAKFNIRYSSDHSADSLKTWLTDHFNSCGGQWSAQWFASADPFITTPGDYTDLVASAVKDVTGKTPQLSTSGGTSDARFIAPYADVVEFGLVGQTMHQVDERTALADLDTLSDIYHAVLTRFFSAVSTSSSNV
ncbi:MAG: succinyl-diaminopimelate desuccinylase [Alphaproteobacteria bacterium]|nr:succinyl-diaminopimelate desuccinylase [Alphaproteobacteria bacterium]